LAGERISSRDDQAAGIIPLAVGQQTGGFAASVLRRLLCWSLFWHALDIVWVGVFMLVYLMGDFR
jgi:heme/copper-type cytochrome/quinol oxidase subunit 3